MKILTALLSATLMILLAVEAVNLHRLTVCRQEAWRSSVTLQTRTLLSSVPVSDKDYLFRCKILVSRSEKRVSWMRLTSPKIHHVALTLRGKL